MGFKKNLDEWEERSTLDQPWEDFVVHFQNSKENFNLKKSIHDKKGGVRRVNAAEEVG